MLRSVRLQGLDNSHRGSRLVPRSGGPPVLPRRGSRRARVSSIDATRPQNVTGYPPMRSNGANPARHPDPPNTTSTTLPNAPTHRSPLIPPSNAPYPTRPPTSTRLATHSGVRPRHLLGASSQTNTSRWRPPARPSPPATGAPPDTGLAERPPHLPLITPRSARPRTGRPARRTCRTHRLTDGRPGACPRRCRAVRPRHPAAPLPSGVAWQVGLRSPLNCRRGGP